MNLTYKEQEELKKIHEELTKNLNNNRPLKNHILATYANPPVQMYPPNYSGVSPTSPESRGMYSYQEPEVDEQGTYYGYKVLLHDKDGCQCPDCFAFRSPCRVHARWKDGELNACHEPAEDTLYGVHCTKRPDHPELMNPRYHGEVHNPYIPEWARGTKNFKSYLVKCALSGTIVETAQGFRAQHARIIGVLVDGYWQSYQDYQERTRSNSRSFPTITWEEEPKPTSDWQYRGRWGYTDPYLNTNP